MLCILFGTMAEMGYKSRQFFEQQGFEQVTKLSYATEEIYKIADEKRRAAQAERSTKKSTEEKHG